MWSFAGSVEPALPSACCSGFYSALLGIGVLHSWYVCDVFVAQLVHVDCILRELILISVILYGL